MIRINLLPQKRARRGVAKATKAPGTDAAAREMALGIGSLLAAAALVFFFLDMPTRSAIADYKHKTESLKKSIADAKVALAGYDVMQAEEADAVKKIQSINRLLEAKVVPAHVLHELGLILNNQSPTMTVRMRDLIKSDPNKRWQNDWDPNHVWLRSFVDTGGKFKLEGGAQSKEDVTQLSKRLAASVYFVDVTPEGGERVTDLESGLNYYKFTISGKVAY
ncbi:MAG TPA: PilN domain-containing protein [Kofleriaceae bacterium]|nr:PilN domain-containing protein [Kofleriaceae bacterium]